MIGVTLLALPMTEMIVLAVVAKDVGAYGITRQGQGVVAALTFDPEISDGAITTGTLKEKIFVRIVANEMFGLAERDQPRQ